MKKKSNPSRKNILREELMKKKNERNILRICKSIFLVMHETRKNEKNFFFPSGRKTQNCSCVKKKVEQYFHFHK